MRFLALDFENFTNYTILKVYYFHVLGVPLHMVALHQLVNVVCPLPPLKNLWAKENMRPCSSVREIMRSLFRSSWRQ